MTKGTYTSGHLNLEDTCRTAYRGDKKRAASVTVSMHSDQNKYRVI